MALVRRERGRVTNLRDLATREIRQMVYSGQLRRGDRIDQQRLASDLGMSLLPVREALISLHNEGLVRRHPHRGAFVSPLTRLDIRDTFELFGHVAGLAAERATSQLGPEQIQRLSDIQDELEAAVDREQQEALNFEFHRLINVASGSQRLISTLRLLGQGVPHGFYEVHGEWRPLALADHRVILEALRAGSGAEANRAMRAHLHRSADQAIELLEQAGFWSDEEPRPAT